MRTIKKEFNVYDYNELNNKAKEKARDEVRKTILAERQSDIGGDVFFYDIDSQLYYDHFPSSDHDLHFQYSFSCAQGDGMNIYGTLNILEQKKIEVPKLLEKFLEDIGFKNVVLPENPRYTYCYVNNLDLMQQIRDSISYYASFEAMTSDFGYYNYTGLLEGEIEVLNNRICDYFKKLCDNFEDQGMDYFYEVSEQEVMDRIVYGQDDYGEEWEFLEDGTIYR